MGGSVGEAVNEWSGSLKAEQDRDLRAVKILTFRDGSPLSYILFGCFTAWFSACNIWYCYISALIYVNFSSFRSKYTAYLKIQDYNMHILRYTLSFALWRSAIWIHVCFFFIFIFYASPSHIS